MITRHTQLVKRAMDRGHREVVFLIDWSGLPEFAPAVVTLYIVQLELESLVWNSGNTPISDLYRFNMRDVLEVTLASR